MPQLTKSTRTLVVQCVSFFILMVVVLSAGAWLFPDVWLGPEGYGQILLSSVVATAVYTAIMFVLQRRNGRRSPER